jgi:chemotaxis protein CheZ
MAPESLLDTNSELIAELKACATLLTEKLQNNQFEDASLLIESITRARDRHIFHSIGKLTRGVHDAIVNFNVDADLTKNPQANSELEMKDASSRLQYVIQLTQQAAEKTMDMVDIASPIATNLGQKAKELRADWLRLKRREMNLDEFRALYDRMNDFLADMEVGTTALNENLQNILLEQGFQDLTGQVLKRVIGLMGDVEKDLVKLVVMASQIEEIAGIVTHSPADEANRQALIEKRKVEAEGPQINKARDNVVSGQDDVDDLLSSLGF